MHFPIHITKQSGVKHTAVRVFPGRSARAQCQSGFRDVWLCSAGSARPSISLPVPNSFFPPLNLNGIA